jgi:hypothetical protein
MRDVQSYLSNPIEGDMYNPKDFVDDPELGEIYARKFDS